MASTYQAEDRDSEPRERLRAFSGARDEYLAAFRRVPPDAVGFRKEGDDYSLGGIAVHVNYVLEHYTNVLNAVIAADFTECRPEDPPELEERARSRAGSAMAYDDLAEELERTQRLHLGVAGIVEAMPAGPERKAPVWYADATEAYPTGVADILGWLSDHYREHIPHLEALAIEWQGDAKAIVTRFCEAFDRGDVDGVMALMTDDCVFESTYPPPDGERHIGQAAVRSYWEQFFGSTQAPVFENEEMFATGDRVVSRWRFSWGAGDLAGHVRGVDVYRTRDGKVAEKLAYVKG